MAVADVDYGSRVGLVAAICNAVNGAGGTQVLVPSHAGSYDHPSTLIKYLRPAAAAAGVATPTDNLDYTGLLPLCNLILAKLGEEVPPDPPDPEPEP